MFLTFYRTSSTIASSSPGSQTVCAQGRKLSPLSIIEAKKKKIKIRHRFTAGYSGYLLPASRFSGDKQSAGRTNTLTRCRCCFHAQNQQNRLRERGGKCQTAAEEPNCCWGSVCFCSGLNSAMLPPAGLQGDCMSANPSPGSLVFQIKYNDE